MTDIEIQCAKAAMAKMMADGYFSITVIDQILKMSGGVPDRRDYDALRLLHCVSFKDFPPRLRIEFPMLLQRVLQSPGMEIEISFKALKPLRLADIQINTQ